MASFDGCPEVFHALIADRIATIPAHRPQDHITLEMAPLEIRHRSVRQSPPSMLKLHDFCNRAHTSIEHSRDWCRSLLILNCQELAAQQPLRPINWCSRLLKMTFGISHKRMFLRELSSAFTRTKGGEAPPLIRPPEISPRQAEGRASLTGPKSPARASAAMTAAALSRVDDGSGGYRQPLAQPRHRGRTASDLEATGPSHPDMDLDARTDVRFRVLGVLR